MPDISDGKAAENAPVSAAAPGAKASTAAADAKVAAKQVNLGRRRLVWACIWGYLGINFDVPAVFLPARAVRAQHRFQHRLSRRFRFGHRSALSDDQPRLGRARAGPHLRDFCALHAPGLHAGMEARENKFKCPCHGSGYDSEGVNFEGPAPRPMDRAHIETRSDGQIVVDTSRLYMDDPRAGVNQFNDPGAFLTV